MTEGLDVTTILLEATAGSAGATDRLLPFVYDELRERAERILRRTGDRTLQVTELVHEAYLRLCDQTRCQWQNRAHFLAVASRAMRRILVDRARRRRSGKRGGGIPKLALEEALVVGTEGADEILLSLEFALEKLSIRHADAARVVEMRFFGGLTNEECACVLGLSPRTTTRLWKFAQAWLYRDLEASGSPT